MVSEGAFLTRKNDSPVATIRAVAALAGVSVATVSHVVNQNAYVSPKLQARVVKAMRELRYHPNGMARGLRTKSSKTIGMIIPNISDPFFHPMVRGAEDALLREGYTLIVGNSDNDLKKEELYYDTFRLKQVDGILVTVSAWERAPEFLLQHNPGACPIVYLDRYLRGLQGDTVLLDNAGTSRLAVNHLAKLGHRHIAIMTGPLILRNANSRLQGYKRALSENNIRIERRLIHEGAFDRASGYELTKTILGLRPRPTAIFASNALMAIGALHAFSDLGVSCPEEIALVSFNDTEMFDLVQPPVTAFRQPVYEVGASGADLLVKRLSDRTDARFRRVVLKPEFILRRSSGSALRSRALCAEKHEAAVAGEGQLTPNQ